MIINIITAAVFSGTAILMACLGEILTERSGNLNLGVEGIMYVGAVAGLAGAVQSDYSGLPAAVSVAAGCMASLLAGTLMSFVYAFQTVTMRVNQNVVGLSMTILGTGLGNYCGELLSQDHGGYVSVGDAVTKAIMTQPFQKLSEIPVIGDLFFSYNWFLYVTLAVAVLMYFYLRKTRTGINLRTVGENPAAADVSGISVTLYRYTATLIGGALCGLAGMYMSMVIDSGVWIHNCVNGYGWLAVALVIFSAWNPLRAIPCSLLFGMLMILRLYISIPGISPYIYDMSPYIATCVIIVINSIRKRYSGEPAALGKNYFREER